MKINKRPDTNEQAGRDCGGGLARLFAARAARPAGDIAIDSIPHRT